MNISKKTIHGFMPVYWATDGTITSNTPFMHLYQELKELLMTCDLMVDLQTINPAIVLSISGGFTSEHDPDAGEFYFCYDDMTPVEFSSFAALVGYLIYTAQLVEEDFFQKRREIAVTTIREPHIIPNFNMEPVPTNDEATLTSVEFQLNEIFLQHPFCRIVYRSNGQVLQITEHARMTGDDVVFEYRVCFRNTGNMTNLKCDTIEEVIETLRNLL